MKRADRQSILIGLLVAIAILVVVSPVPTVSLAGSNGKAAISPSGSPLTHSSRGLIPETQGDPSGAGDWTQFQGGPAHNGVSRWPGPANNSTLWTYGLGGSEDSLIEYGGNILSSEPDVEKRGWYGFNATTGSLTITGYTAHTIGGDPTNLATFYIPEGQDQVLAENYCNFCFFSEGPWLTMDNASSGGYIWQQGTSGAPGESPYYGWGLASYSNGLFYFGLNGTTGITALYPNETTAWSSNFRGEQATLPTFGSGLMLEGFANLSEVQALWSSNGTPAWYFNTDAQVLGSPSYANGTFYFGSVAGTAYSVSATGTLNWRQNDSCQNSNPSTRTPIVATPVVSSGVAYFACTNGNLVALNSATGALLWFDHFGGQLVASPVLGSNGILYVGSTANAVHAVQASDGAPVWNLTTSGNVSSSPLLYGGRLYFTDRNGTIFAIGGPGYLVSFVESGLPNGAVWNVTAGGIRLSSTASVIAFDFTNGTRPYSIGGPKGYVPTPVSGTFDVNGSDLTIDVKFHPSSLPLLTVQVVGSSDGPISGANISVNGTTVLSNSSGEAGFYLAPGSYNVSSSAPGLLSDYQKVNLTASTTVELTLARPYDFLGVIPASNVRINETPSGYDISLLSLFPAAEAQIFFDWVPVGSITAGGGWTTFSASAPPNYIVMAAAPGSPDYPDAYYLQLSLTMIQPTNNGCGAFQDTSRNPWNPSILASPDPPVVGEPTNISVELHNSCSYSLNISELDFQISGLDAGGTGWTTIGIVTNITLSPGENKTVSVIWSTNLDPALVGLHHCVRVWSTYHSTPPPQCPNNYCPIQHNLDLEPELLSGEVGTAKFVLGSEFATAEQVTVSVTQTLPSGWTTSLVVNGENCPTPGSVTISMAAGQILSGMLSITPNTATPGNATVNITANVNGGVYGGFQKTMQELPPGVYPIKFTESGLPGGTSWSVTLGGSTKTSTGTTLYFPEPDGSYSYSVGTVTGYTAAPAQGTLTVSGAPVAQAVTFVIANLGPQYCVTISPGAIGVAAGLSIDLEGDEASGSLDFNGSLTLTPSLSICLGTTPGLLGFPSPNYLNITESLLESARIDVNATGTFSYNNTDDPAVLAGPFSLGFYCVSVLCFDVQASIDLEVNASLTASGSLEIDQGVNIQSSQNYSFTSGLWTQVPVSEACESEGESISNGCITVTTGASVQGDLDLRLGPMVDLDPYGLGVANLYFYPYAEMNISAGYSTSGGPVGNCGSATLGWSEAVPWVVGCAGFGIEVGGEILDDDITSVDWTILGFPVAASVLVCDTTQGGPCGNAYTMPAGATNSFDALAAVSGVSFTWTSPCLAESQTGSVLSFTAPLGGMSTCSITLDTNLPLAIPFLDISEEIVTITIKQVAFAVTFTESKLPALDTWYINVTGGPSLSTTGATATLKTNLDNGTYNYTVATNNKTYAPSFYKANFTVDGGAVATPTIMFALFTYPVKFTEPGLPDQDTWYVNITNGPDLSATGATTSLTANLVNGTYDYTVATNNKTYAPSFYKASFNVNGASVEPPPIIFTPVTYTVTISESGLPAGTSWSVAINSVEHSSTSRAISFAEVNGSYRYVTSIVAGGNSTGSLTVNGAALAFTVAFYTATFIETGLPPGTHWPVTTNDVALSSTTSRIVFYLTNGSYTFHVGLVPGYHTTTSGGVTVHGASATVNLAFVVTTYTVTFTETGLPTGTTWAVTLGGTTKFSTGTTISFTVHNGSYSFEVSAADYKATPSSGTLQVNGSPVTQAVSFTKITSPAEVLIAVARDVPVGKGA